MSETILRVRSVNKIVNTADQELTILKDITFDLNAGHSLAIVGPSGAGKSTLLGLLAGLDEPSSGEIWLAQHDITGMNEESRAKVRAELVGFVFQTFQLLGSLTALENVALPMELAGTKNAQARAKEYLAKVGLAQRMSHYPRQLSGGEQQRVAVARAFACTPKLLFADEPTGNLDQATGARVSDLLFELNEQTDTTLILVTHEQRLADRCQTTITIDGGQLTDTKNNESALNKVSA